MNIAMYVAYVCLFACVFIYLLISSVADFQHCKCIHTRFLAVSLLALASIDV